MKTQTEKLLDALNSGQTFTAATAAKRFKMPVTSVNKRIHDLKNEGYMIYSNRVKGSNVVEYRLGTPSRAVVRAGIVALREQGIAV